MTGLLAVLIPADRTKPAQIVRVGHDAADIADAIGCEWIETVRTAWLRDRQLLMIVDEEGRLNGQPVNPRASRIYQSCETGDHLWPTPISGDVLIVADAGEDFASLSPFQVGMISGLDFIGAVKATEEARS